MNRRSFLRTTLATTLGTWLAAAQRSQSRPQRIVLRSAWQTVNIGDIGHTPGVLALLEQYLPDVDVTLWPSKVDNGVAELLRGRFPKLTIIDGPQALETALAQSDFLLHGSGASLVAANDVARWIRETGKPFGIYGITLPQPDAKSLELISAAEFTFFRDSVSLQLAKDHGATCPIMEFGPDGAFGVDLRNEAAAERFLAAHDLQPGRFLCCIPRLRYTPYWLIHNRAMTAEDQRKHARNEEMKQHDHLPLREAISAVTRETGMKVLVCPEDQSQVAIGKAMLVDPLPDDVRRLVVWRDRYWLTDEALSTYVRSAGLFGNEMHSPIMCIGNGVPAIVCRFAEQTSKGFMWRDIGLADWLFDLDQPADIERIVPTVLALAQNPAAAKAKAAEARQFVEQRQRETMATLQKTLDHSIND